MKKTADKIKRIGLIANTEKPSSRAVLHQAAALIAKAHRVALCDAATAGFAEMKIDFLPDQAALAREVDLLMVCGGDGTILRVVREIDGIDTPIIGINVGRLGFLTAVPSHKLQEALQKIWENEFWIESRPLLEATGTAQKTKFKQTALNDVVISRGSVPRMIDLDVSVDDQSLTHYRCDGLIVSSPTGSTAYSLSAGGAIISPNANVFAVTPICPHALSNRSIIISMDSTINVKVMSERVHTTISMDGQIQLDLAAKDVISIRQSRSKVHLLHLNGSSFFDTLRHKLHWSGSNV